MTLHTYLPQDRLRALARGETLPDRTRESALFADISGFTALTKSMSKALARQTCGEMHQFARTIPIVKSRALLWQGLYDWLNGKPRSAQKYWQKSLAVAQKMSMPYDEALAYCEIGRHATGAERKQI